jgi:hypothetical protein
MTIPVASAGKTSDIADITIPDSPAALEEMLGDWKRTKPLAEAGLLPEAIERYAKTVVAKDVEIARQVQEGVQAVTHKFLREHAEDGVAPPRQHRSAGQRPHHVGRRVA